MLLSAGDRQVFSIPLSFEENQGQVVGTVQYLSRGDGYQLSIASNQAILSLQAPDGTGVDRVSMNLVGAQDPTGARGVDPLPGKVNYFLGPDPAQWRTNVPTFAKVQYDNVYLGVDLVYYGTNQGATGI